MKSYTTTIKAGNAVEPIGICSVSKAEKSSTENTKIQQRLQKIINKFKMGKKLSANDLSFLAKNSPATYQKVIKVIQERERVEKQMEQAKTKEDVERIMQNVLSNVEKAGSNAENEFEVTAKLNQYNDAYRECKSTREYREKTDTQIDLEKERISELARAAGVDIKENKSPEAMKKELQEELDKSLEPFDEVKNEVISEITNETSDNTLNGLSRPTDGNNKDYNVIDGRKNNQHNIKQMAEDNDNKRRTRKKFDISI